MSDPTRDALEGEIAQLLEPGLRANRWRADFEAFRQRRLWDENRHGRRLRLLRREFRCDARAPILDLGTGRGGLAVALARDGRRIVALDLRHRCCRLARLRAQRYALELGAVQGRGERLPFGDEVFAGVICRDVIEHAAQPARLLGEIWRVLRVGGACYLTVINRWCWVDPHYHLLGLSWLPRRVADAYVAGRGRAKLSGQDHQRLADMHYYGYGEFARWAASFGFALRDLRLETLARYRTRSLGHRVRWLRERLLRPLSLQSNQFDFLLSKPRASVWRGPR
jgi:SAM-dependent methyltransferase